MDKLLNLILESPSMTYFKIKKENMLDEFNNRTSFLDKIYKTVYSNQRIWHIVNKTNNVPICKMCGNKHSTWDERRKKYSLCCSQECLKLYYKTDEYKKLEEEKRKQTNLKNYGVENYYDSEDYKKRQSSIREKQKQTNLERYGVENPAKSKELIEKQKQTNLERYGVENPAKSKEIYEKGKETRKKLYGAEYYSQSKDFQERKEEIVEKIQSSLKENFGVDNYMKSKDFQERKEEIVEKRKLTFLRNFGVDNYAKSNDFRKNIPNMVEKQSQTCLEKYGVPFYAMTEDWKEKSRKSYEKRYNNQFYSGSDQHLIDQQNKWKQTLLNDGFENISYIRSLRNEQHIMHCNDCGKDFEILSTTYNIRKKLHQIICTNCNPTVKNYSYSEKELLSYIQSIYKKDIEFNTKKIIKDYELDIYLPELKLAVEYNGLYWHSSGQKDKNYHKRKSDLCKEKGIHLIHIFEDDWFHKKDIIKSVLSNFINPSNNQKIYARKCTIKEVSFKDTNEFLEENHLLGKSMSFSKCYGLYYNDELVSLMTFKLISKETNQYELQRYAIKKYTTIIGGAERLFKQFINNVDYSSIITYNDNSIFRGNIYPKLGFKYVRTNNPNYMFIDSKHCVERISKQSIRKLKVGYSIEKEKELGLLRVYNAGNDVYILESAI